MEFAEAHRAAIKANAEVPALEPPEFLPGLYGWYEDFFELSTERQIGMVVGPIPKSSIDRHVEGWVYHDADMFRECIRAMDSVYLSKQNGDKTKQETNLSILASDNPARDQFMAAFGNKKGNAPKSLAQKKIKRM